MSKRPCRKRHPSEAHSTEHGESRPDADGAIRWKSLHRRAKTKKTVFFASTHSPIPTRQSSLIGGFDAVAPHTSIVLFVSSRLLFKTKFLFFYLNKSEAGTNNEVWKERSFKSIQNYTKVYKTIHLDKK